MFLVPAPPPPPPTAPKAMRGGGCSGGGGSGSGSGTDSVEMLHPLVCVGVGRCCSYVFTPCSCSLSLTHSLTDHQYRVEMVP